MAGARKDKDESDKNKEGSDKDERAQPRTEKERDGSERDNDTSSERRRLVTVLSSRFQCGRLPSATERG